MNAPTDHAESPADRRQRIRRLQSEFADLPPEAVLKEDLLRTGIAFSTEALRYCAEFKTKSYFIFSFDMVPIDDMSNAVRTLSYPSKAADSA